ncbi:MAG: tRNA preQ1(34) S-adenosylmethionine ribosyltransferase-isomerase QueA [Alphaproteobacteria bacterium]|nr:tRNA preQ1(34) S-adenosylmethionine ribosyltransferase-isomerase QueA [Alphaproteobacteria bacterium]
MLVSDFDFILPKERIASCPAEPRESAGLLHVCPPDSLTDLHIADFPSLLRSDDLLVFNDTRVIPARLFGYRGQAAVEATLFKSVGLNQWEALVKNARRLHEGDTVQFYPPKAPQVDPLEAKVLGRGEDGKTVVLEFLTDPSLLFAALEKYGVMPLPPYIHREKEEYENDKRNYQTVYAAHDGAVAAPTAGLHFTKELLAKIDSLGIENVKITLHVGGGTFLPVKVEDTKDHVMHAEFGHISAENARLITRAKQSGRRIVSIGTTALRLLESAADESGQVHSFNQETSIFITPGYRFKVVDALFTNFHLPCSTLFMLVCAFSGTECMKNAYQHAIKHQYRFFSYGDACFLEKNN